MGRISHIFTDLDSTFFHWSEQKWEGGQNNISSSEFQGVEGVIKRRTLEAVQLLEKQGVYVIPCTGRYLEEAELCFKNLRIEEGASHLPLLNTIPGIYADGLTVIDQDRKILSPHHLSRPQLEVILAGLDEFVHDTTQEGPAGERPRYPHPCNIYLLHGTGKKIINHPKCDQTLKWLHASKHGCPDMFDNVDHFCHKMHLNHGSESLASCLDGVHFENQDGSHFTDLLDDILLALEEPPLSIQVMVPEKITEEDLKRLQSSIELEGVDVRAFFDHGFIIARDGCDKGGGILKYKDEFREQAFQEYVVIGDDRNDVPMFNLSKTDPACAEAYVMGQSRPPIKAAATCVVRATGEDGWFDAAVDVLERNIKWAANVGADASAAEREKAMAIVASTPEILEGIAECRTLHQLI